MQNKFQNKYRIPSSRLQTWDYGTNGAYFITICTQNREHFFGVVQNGTVQLSEIGKIAEQLWLEIPNQFPFIELGNFVVMPNHVHGILIINKIVSQSVETRLIASNNIESIDNKETRLIASNNIESIDNKETRLIASNNIESIDNKETRLIASNNIESIDNKETRLIAYNNIESIDNKETRLIASNNIESIDNKETRLIASNNIESIDNKETRLIASNNIESIDNKETRLIASNNIESIDNKETRLIASNNIEPADNKETRLIAYNNIEPTDNKETRLIASLPNKNGGFSGDKNPMLNDNISKIIRWYKGRCSFECRKINSDFGWQSRFHDHIIRNSKSFDIIQNYIFENPMNWEKDKFYNL